MFSLYTREHASGAGEYFFDACGDRAYDADDRNGGRENPFVGLG